MEGFTMVLFGGIIFILGIGLILTILRNYRGRNSEEKFDAIKSGITFTTIFVVIYILIICLWRYILIAE